MNEEIISNIMQTTAIVFVFTQVFISTKGTRNLPDIIIALVLGSWGLSVAAFLVSIFYLIWI